MDLAGRSIKAQFKLADREKATFCIVVGDAELTSGNVVVKDLRTGEQTNVSRNDLVTHLSRALAST